MSLSRTALPRVGPEGTIVVVVVNSAQAAGARGAAGAPSLCVDEVDRLHHVAQGG